MSLKKYDALKIVALALSWSTISFLFLYLWKRWNMPRKWLRNTLFFVSPLAIVFYSMTILIVMILIECNHPGTFNMKGTSDSDFVDSKRIERISGVYLELGEIIDEQQSEVAFNGDSSTDMKVILNRKPDYVLLDSLVHAKKWMKYDGVYSFDIIWGNDLPAPPGEDDNEDRMLSIRIPTNSDTITISTGIW